MLRRNRQRGCAVFFICSPVSQLADNALFLPPFFFPSSLLLAASTVLPRMWLTLLCALFCVVAFVQSFRLPRRPRMLPPPSLVVFVISCPRIVPAHVGRCSKNTAR
jgi:hypothetical protein